MKEEEIVLKKLGLEKRSAGMILANKLLCRRICDEEVMEIKEASVKHDIALHVLKDAVKGGKLTGIRNGREAKGRKTFVFIDELYEAFDLDSTLTPSFVLLSMAFLKNMLPVYESVLNEREYEVFRHILGGADGKDLSPRFNIGRQRIYQIFHKSLRKIKFYHLYAMAYTELSTENERLKIENRWYAKLNKLAFNKFRKTPPYNITDANFLTMPLSEADLSFRTLNCLKYADINKVSDLLNYVNTHDYRKTLLKFRNFGKKCLNEVEDFLQEINEKNFL